MGSIKVYFKRLLFALIGQTIIPDDNEIPYNNPVIGTSN